MNNNRLMRIENLVVNCTARYPRTCRRTPFEVVVYELNYSSEDKELMDLLRTKAEELARQVNPGAQTILCMKDLLNVFWLIV